MKGLYAIVNLARYFSLPYNSVMPDFLLGVYNMVSYLIRELGHRKIAFIGGETSNYHADRFAGYKMALESHFIDFRKDYCARGIEYPQTGNFDISIAQKDSYDAMKKFLELKNLPTAVFADTDLKAFGAIKAIQDSGLRVPEDISVAGFDNIPDVEKNPVKLTTVNLPLSRLGEKAVDILIERILNKGKNIPSMTVYGELVFRNSCGPVKERVKL
jgi:DNA-binding LacI/PurR family transcriptional regulator